MTLQSLIRCAEREESLRRSYYPRRVERGQMTQEMMDHEIQCMAEIAHRLRTELVATMRTSIPVAMRSAAAAAAVPPRPDDDPPEPGSLEAHSQVHPTRYNLPCTE